VSTFESWDCVQLDITDTTDPDFEWHGEHGRVVEVLKDDAREVTGDDRDSRLYRVDLADHDQTLDLRHRNLRSPLEE
jgi:hypothetical protein